jgi:16S rRNA (cytidine1402-2'-O)-methyltransferase
LHNINIKINNNYGILYVVATPIGNINDITYRAVETLSSVHIIATEDTRHSKKLLNHYGIKTKQISYYKHNENERVEYLINLLLEGKSIALISDAGTPAISDPGDIIITEAHRKNIMVSPVPGASSVISAISCSGQASNDFKFIGFLPKKVSQKIDILKRNDNNDFSLVFFESPNRVVDTLDELKKLYCGDRAIIIAREITKIYEDIKILTIDQWLEYFSLNNNEKQKGEFVVIIPRVETIENKASEREIEDFIILLLKNDISYNTAIKVTSKHYDINKNLIYKKHMHLAKK